MYSYRTFEWTKHSLKRLVNVPRNVPANGVMNVPRNVPANRVMNVLKRSSKQSHERFQKCPANRVMNVLRNVPVNRVMNVLRNVPANRVMNVFRNVQQTESWTFSETFQQNNGQKNNYYVRMRLISTLARGDPRWKKLTFPKYRKPGRLLANWVIPCEINAKKKSPTFDFVDILGVGWLYGETTLSEIWALSIT